MGGILKKSTTANLTANSVKVKIFKINIYSIRKNLILAILFFSVFLNSPLFAQSNKRPLIYSTDLFHPPADPDDTFDLVALYALRDSFDIKGIILDRYVNQDRDRATSGSLLIDQMNHLTGENIPWVQGLGSKLASPTDKGTNQPALQQAGVNLILNTLKNSSEKVIYLCVGSVRDIAAACNRNQSLCEEKIDKVVPVIHMSDGNNTEFNTKLDPNAWVSLVRSDLNIYWVPVADQRSPGGAENLGNSSMVQPSYKGILQNTPDKILNFLIYNIFSVTSDPISYLSGPVDENKKDTLFYGKTKATRIINGKAVKSMWSAHIMPYFANRKVIQAEGVYYSVPQSDPRPVSPYITFETVNISIKGDATILYNQPDSKPKMRLKILNDSAKPIDILHGPFAISSQNIIAQLMNEVLEVPSVNIKQNNRPVFGFHNEFNVYNVNLNESLDIYSIDGKKISIYNNYNIGAYFKIPDKWEN